MPAAPIDPMVSSTLAAKAWHAAELLRRRGGGAGGRPVAAVSASPAVLCVLAHAVPALGVPLLPLDPALPDAVIEELLGQTGSGLVIGERRFAGHDGVEPAAILAAETTVSLPPARLAPGDIALMVATSGSTGHPKAVMLPAGSLRAAAQAAAAHTPLGRGDRWLTCLPLFHIGGYSILLRCALAGAEAVLQQGFDAERVIVTLRQERITHLSLVPAMLALLLELGSAPPPALRHVLVGGAALPLALAERAVAQGWPIQPTYGMSETASQIATLPHLTLPWRPGLVGRPLPGVELDISADGRLKVRGPMLMAGYANPARTPGDGLEAGWFVTGDRAELAGAGELVILGRADDIIVSGGKKIHPAGVEETLLRCPGVTAAAVVGRPDPVWGAIVTALYSGTLEEAELLAWCRENIPGASRPRAALRVATLPRLASGKPDRHALRRLAAGEG